MREKRYFVCREYSHTDRRQLWQVLSRGIKDKQSALDWLDFERAQDIKKSKKYEGYEYFIVEKDVEVGPESGSGGKS